MASQCSTPDEVTARPSLTTVAGDVMGGRGEQIAMCAWARRNQILVYARWVSGAAGGKGEADDLSLGVGFAAFWPSNRLAVMVSKNPTVTGGCRPVTDPVSKPS